MDDLCRLCMSVSDQIMVKLTKGCCVLNKIETCLTVKIHIRKSLPQHICTQCIKKIEDVYNFHKVITENQQKLQKLSKSGLNLKKKFENFNDNIPETENTIEKKFIVKENIVEMEISNVNDNYTDQNTPIIDIKQENVNEYINCYDNNLETSCDNNLSLSMLVDKNNLDDEKKIIQELQNNTDNTYGIENGGQLNHKTCLTCFETFETKTSLIKHYHVVHKNNEEVSEPMYMVNEGITMRYRCKVCNNLFDKKEDVIKHMAVHRRPFICKICGRTYKTVTEIVRHSRAHSSHKLLCSYQCGFSTAYKGALKDHEKRHLEKPDYKYKCTQCDKGFFVKTWYEQHQNIHNGLKPFVCDLCGMAFHIERYLTAHRSTVHPQSSNVKRFVCVHCLHPCDCAKSLAEHLKEHGIKTEFLCDECGKIFKNADKLRNHKYTHLQLKPHTCSICNKSYAKKFTLKLHENAHTGERLHACAHCDKKYVQKATLHRHYRRQHSDVTKNK